MAGLTPEDLVHVARRSVGDDVSVRDPGLLAAALARVEACVFGQEVYPTVREKAAALLHSLVTTAPLREGNRPFALATTLVFLAQHDEQLTLSDADAVAVVTAIVTGRLESVHEIALALEHGLG
ncbi:type II toxin-antitoxin system death-on-curing family toxin [Modestobacter versicolor]|uniref:Death-on-curing protein n=1 Tax=Modestobacter versicolor TaxID=429133 RepID=A0A323V5J8_9ACTN|nr:Fic family protein [Modestobacter versicolor]MBB3677591.1 death-on-curing protein [Modestobacter versicolor]PZA20147.1 type II toxin-antitoxin system death-on-curing family toxin [Modestobacter versicolor]